MIRIDLLERDPELNLESPVEKVHAKDTTGGRYTKLFWSK